MADTSHSFIPPTCFSSDRMMKQANQLWKMLDEMSEHNPKGYKNFIEKNLEESRKSVKPAFHSSVHTFNQKKEKTKFSLNIFSWTKVSTMKGIDEDHKKEERIENENQEGSVPLHEGEIIEINHEGTNEKIQMVSVALHPSVLTHFMRDGSQERRELVELLLQATENHNHIKLNRTQLSFSQECVGGEEKAIYSLTKTLNRNETNGKDNKNNNIYDDILKSLNNKENNDDNDNNKIIINSDIDSKKKYINKNNKLIEEISAPSVNIKQPLFKAFYINNNKKKIKLMVWLPEVYRSEDVVVQASEDDIIIEARHEYFLYKTFLEIQNSIICSNTNTNTTINNKVVIKEHNGNDDNKENEGDDEREDEYEEEEEDEEESVEDDYQENKNIKIKSLYNCDNKNNNDYNINNFIKKDNYTTSINNKNEYLVNGVNGEDEKLKVIAEFDAEKHLIICLISL